MNKYKNETIINTLLKSFTIVIFDSIKIMPRQIFFFQKIFYLTYNINFFLRIYLIIF